MWLSLDPVVFRDHAQRGDNLVCCRIQLHVDALHPSALWGRGMWGDCSCPDSPAILSPRHKRGTSVAKGHWGGTVWSAQHWPNAVLFGVGGEVEVGNLHDTQKNLSSSKRAGYI